MIDYMAKGGQMAEEFFNCSGIHYPGHIGMSKYPPSLALSFWMGILIDRSGPLPGPWGMTSSDGGDMGQRSSAAFSAVIFANYYMYSLDNDWLYTGTTSDHPFASCDADG
jgi:hypothetical protein